jgi:hypothetical protein
MTDIVNEILASIDMDGVGAIVAALLLLYAPMAFSYIYYRAIRRGRIWRCRRCGWCCRKLWIPLAADERERFGGRRFLNTSRTGCDHLVVESGVASCSVYDGRPSACRTYPLHEYNGEHILDLRCRFDYRK